METIDILQQFCDSAGERVHYDLQKPFVFNGFCYATDGAIGARVPSSEENTQGRFPKTLETAFAEPESDLQEVELPVVVCEKCNSTGVIHYEEIKCVLCCNSGVVAHHCDCSLCSESEETCPRCNGKCREAYDANCKCSGYILGLKIATRYITKLRTLPSLKFYRNKDDKHELRFSFEGGIGVVMSLETH